MRRVMIRMIFQSTLPAGGATLLCILMTMIFIFQSTLPAGGATNSGFMAAQQAKFQSTLPAGGATYQFFASGLSDSISIHAPRRGSDRKQFRSCKDASYFNPRSPQGERLPPPVSRILAVQFQSTLPAGGATHNCFLTLTFDDISIHAPRRGSDTILTTIETIR